MIKADIGSIGGHVTPSTRLLDTVREMTAARKAEDAEFRPVLVIPSGRLLDDAEQSQIIPIVFVLDVFVAGPVVVPQHVDRKYRTEHRASVVFGEIRKAVPIFEGGITAGAMNADDQVNTLTVCDA